MSGEYVPIILSIDSTCFFIPSIFQVAIFRWVFDCYKFLAVFCSFLKFLLSSLNYILQIDTMSRRPGRGRGGRGSQGQAAPDVNGNQPSTAPRAQGRG